MSPLLHLAAGDLAGDLHALRRFAAEADESVVALGHERRRGLA